MVLADILFYTHVIDGKASQPVTPDTESISTPNGAPPLVTNMAEKDGVQATASNNDSFR